MPKTAAKTRLIALVGIMLVAVCVPWARGAPGVSRLSVSVASACCCGFEGGACCCAERSDESDGAENSTSAPRCCACAEQPVDRGGPWLMLLMSGMTPVGWQPGPAAEAAAVPTESRAPTHRVEARAPPVLSTASRLARLGVRTT